MSLDPGRVLRGVRRARTALRRRRAGPRHALVEEFGPDGLAGWVEVPRGAPPVRVALCVGRTEVVTTWASGRAERASHGEVRGFSLTLDDLWQFVGRRDRLSVRIDGLRVPVVGRGLDLVPEHDGEHDLRVLERERAQGKVFDRHGRLLLSKRLDVAWQATVLGLYARARAVLAAELGHDVFLVYGTLLGAVRDGGFLGHDDDFDCAYVSRLTDPREVAAELQAIAFLLLEHGFDVDCRAQLLHLHDPDDPDVRIDLFHLFFDATGTLCFPWGAAGTTTLQRADWPGVREVEFAGGPALVPVASQALLEVLYGSGWRLPVPGFSWAREKRVEAREARVPQPRRDEVRWERFWARTGFDAPSAFCTHLLARADLPAAVVDLGCGNGRDALALAGSGRTVLGLDRSVHAVRRAGERAVALGLAERVDLVVGDVADAEAVAALLDRARGRSAGGPVLVYARFLLHAVPRGVQDALLPVLLQRSRPGDELALELRTTQDRELPKAHPDGYRRFQDGPALGRRLAAGGFALLEEQHGTGLAPYGDEDPHVYRVLARRR